MVEGVSIAWWAALLGLALAVVLILKKLNATYALCQPAHGIAE